MTDRVLSIFLTEISRGCTETRGSFARWDRSALVTIKEISQFWELACEDAGYQSGGDAVLYVLPGDAADGAAALHVEPSTEVAANSAWPLAGNQVEDANSGAKKDLHRIFVRDFVSPRVALGRLRHELEHGRQYDRSPDVYSAMSFARDGLSRAFEERDPPSLIGSATLYNLLPFEEDANRASARLTISHFGPPTDAELASTDAPLFRDDGLVDPDTLSLRTLAFAGLFPAGVSWVAEQRDESMAELVAHFGPDALAVWELLRRHSEIASFGHAALASCPSEEEITSDASPSSAWLPVKAQIDQGMVAAESLLKDEMPNLRLH